MKLFEFEGDRRRSLIYDLLRNWHKTLLILEEAMGKDDLPYVYRERPNLGVLVVAATRVGYFPFEEYSMDKGRGQKWRQGRADLWLVNRDGSKAFDFEAKYIDVSFNSKRLAKTIKPHLDEAARDVSQLNYKANCSLGILFICPYGAISKLFNPKPFWNQIRNYKAYDGDFCALHICPYEVWTENIHKGRPGIAVVGRYI